MQRESFIFYQSFRNATKHLPKENQKNALVMIVEYGIDGIEPEPETDGVAYAMFTMAKPQLDANNKRFSNGKNGGRPKKEEPNNNQGETKTEPNYNQNETEVEPNVNVNVNVNDKENNNPLNPPQVEGEKISKKKCDVKIEKYFESWNSQKLFKRCNEITPEIRKERNRLCKLHTKEKIIQGTKNYIKDITDRDKSSSYATHRFSLYEFLKQGNGLVRFINK